MERKWIKLLKITTIKMKTEDIKILNINKIFGSISMTLKQHFSTDNISNNFLHPQFWTSILSLPAPLRLGSSRESPSDSQYELKHFSSEVAPHSFLQPLTHLCLFISPQEKRMKQRWDKVNESGVMSPELRTSNIWAVTLSSGLSSTGSRKQ